LEMICESIPILSVFILDSHRVTAGSVTVSADDHSADLPPRATSCHAPEGCLLRPCAKSLSECSSGRRAENIAATPPQKNEFLFCFILFCSVRSKVTENIRTFQPHPRRFVCSQTRA
jgi:hypothetical protein